MTTLKSSPARSGVDSVNLSSRFRADFPILAQAAPDSRPLIYLDHAATSQKPQQVIDAMQRYYSCDNANVHRGAHQLSARATEAFEAARTTAAAFVGARSPREIVFTRNASEAINLVARSWGDSTLREGDEVLLTGDGASQQFGALAASGAANRLCPPPCRADRRWTF